MAGAVLVKPARFRYHAPSELKEALSTLNDLRDDDVKVLAGGQSLLPLMNMRLARPKHLVDINDVSELSYIRAEEDGGLSIGALTRHRALERSPEVTARAPLLAEVMPLIGDRQVRCRGTMGGSLAHADPVAEIPTVALTLDAEFVIGNVRGTQTVRAADFCVSYLTTVLEPADLLLEVRLPAPPPGAGFAFLELVRQQGAFAIVSAATMVSVRDGVIDEARICLGGVAPTPIRATRAEVLLRGKQPTADAFAAAARLAAEDTDPGADVHGSEDYRREMAEVFTRRALATALERPQRT
jgi:carbon-monoxide dehydrogenase medium subunit